MLEGRRTYTIPQAAAELGPGADRLGFGEWLGAPPLARRRWRDTPQTGGATARLGTQGGLGILASGGASDAWWMNDGRFRGHRSGAGAPRDRLQRCFAANESVACYGLGVAATVTCPPVGAETRESFRGRRNRAWRCSR